ncbi:MAG: hypothetical protein OK457_00525 [Thaumarchaeota archaeon]|nr:hypothetical protein [Nitrososphaerota archaeon]
MIRKILIVLLSIMFFSASRLLAIDSAKPSGVMCPIDDTWMMWTGSHRKSVDEYKQDRGVLIERSHTECFYSHVNITYDGTTTHDEVHSIWLPCEVKND